MSKQHILIIDDDPDLLALENRILDTAGYSVSKSDTIQNAIVMLTEHCPDLILLDLNFPTESGYVLLKAIQKLRADQRPKVIVVSASLKKQDIIQSITLGAVDYIMKPIESRIMLQKIKKALHDKSSLSLILDESHISEMKMTIRCRITASTPLGFVLEAPVKIKEGEPIALECQHFKNIGIDQAVFKKSAKPSKFSWEGNYYNDITAGGINPSVLKKMHYGGSKL